MRDRIIGLLDKADLALASATGVIEEDSLLPLFDTVGAGIELAQYVEHAPGVPAAIAADAPMHVVGGDRQGHQALLRGSLPPFPARLSWRCAYHRRDSIRELMVVSAML
jgi:hypothetical protein